MHLTASIALALSMALGSTSTPPAPVLLTQVQTVREYVAQYFSDIPIMVAISSCESHFRQYDHNGAAFRGEENHQDIGVMQINEYYHLKTATELGFDIYTTKGNVEYARYLYEHEGTAPWMSSSACWDKHSTKPLAVAKN